MTDYWQRRVAADKRHSQAVCSYGPDSRAAAAAKADLDSIEGDDYIPDSIADIAAEHGVTEAQLRAALRESHPDASVAEVLLAAREVEA